MANIRFSDKDVVTSIDGSEAIPCQLPSDGDDAHLTPDQLVTYVQSELGVESNADVTDATNVNAAGAVMESDYNAQTILAATNDNTPAPVTVGESQIVGRNAGGNVGALTAANVRTIINVEDGADVTDATNVAAAGAVMESDIAAKGDLFAGSADNTVVIITMGTDGQVLTADSAEAGGMKWDDAPGAGGGIDTSGTPVADDFAVFDDVNTVRGLDATEARALLNVEDGADVTDATNVAAAGAVMKTDVAAKGDLFVATADNTVGILTKGTDGHVLTADSGETTGLIWTAPSGGGGGGITMPPIIQVGRPYGPRARDWDNATPVDQELYLAGWFEFNLTLSAADLLVMVTTEGVEGAGAEMHIGLYDSNGDLHDSGIVDVTATGKASIVLTQDITPGFYLPAVLRLGTWSVSPILRGCQDPQWGADRYLVFNSESQAGMRRHWTLTGQSSLPASLNLATLPISGADTVATCFVEPN